MRLREKLRDAMVTAFETMLYVRKEAPKHKRWRDKLALAPLYLATLRAEAEMDKLQLDPKDREGIRRALQGNGDGTEHMVKCEACELAFEPGYNAPDATRATSTKCAGCVREALKVAAEAV